MAISFVGEGTPFTTSGIGEKTSYQIRKPSGTASGDFMIAVLCAYTFENSAITVTPPSGWTMVRSFASGANQFAGFHMAVMRRTAGASEPSSWAGSVSSGAYQLTAQSVSYRGVASIIVNGQATKGAATSYATATVNNPAANNWRVVAAGYTHSSGSYNVSVNDTAQRSLDSSSDFGVGGANFLQGGIWDSSGAVAAGNTSRTVSRGTPWSYSGAWIGILDASGDLTSSGSLSGTLKIPTMSATMKQTVQGSYISTIPKPTMTAAGIASPPDGPLTLDIVPVMSFDGVTVATGTADLVITPVVTLVAETKRFSSGSGPRMVEIASESRVVTPRASDVAESSLFSLVPRLTVGGDVLSVRLPSLVVAMSG